VQDSLIVNMLMRIQLHTSIDMHIHSNLFTR
jgi:hypothetical protein